MKEIKPRAKLDMLVYCINSISILLLGTFVMICSFTENLVNFDSLHYTTPYSFLQI